MEYVLVTPARDEAKTIGHAIASVLAQTHPPRRWVIVSDGSTDGTDDVVRAHLGHHPMLRFVRVDADRPADFASKVAAFNRGLQELAGVDYDLIGNLDADVSFEADYFEKLVATFEREPSLGLAGGQIYETADDGELLKQDVSANSVAGAVQLFRREVFESIGGLPRLRQGGEDTVAEINVRMRGYAVRTLSELHVQHHGRVVSGSGSLLHYRFRKGVNHYRLGYDPWFHLLSCAYRSAERPRLLGGLLMALGYAWAALRRRERAVGPDVVAFLRREQRGRIRGLLRGEGADRA